MGSHFDSHTVHKIEIDIALLGVLLAMAILI
jgi:hypothetical protein